MKAALVHRQVTFPRTHDLLELAELLRDHYPEWTYDREELRLLARGAVVFRYPGEDADRKHAARGLATSTRLRDRVVVLILTSESGGTGLWET